MCVRSAGSKCAAFALLSRTLRTDGLARVRDEVRPVGLGDETRAVIFRVLGGESVHQELHSFWSHGDWPVWEFGVPVLDFFCDRMC